MISVCVPVFNVDTRKLARQLADQAGAVEERVEVLFFDDFSDEKFRKLNRQIAEINGVIYREMEQNYGRAAIRNLMGKSASCPWLLFLDGDSLIDRPDFLNNYIQAASSAHVVCGGTIYSPVPPEDKSSLLRWIYGSKREQLTAGQRTSGNKFAITANNFLIKKEVFLQHGFRETITGYGHEDTVLGYDLCKAGIPVSQIDNPVIHTGLETSPEYLLKTKKALDNLWFISREVITDPQFKQESGLLRWRLKFKRLGVLGLSGKLFRWVEPLFIRNLTGSHPRLLIFDLYRIGYLCQVSRANRSDI